MELSGRQTKYDKEVLKKLLVAGVSKSMINKDRDCIVVRIKGIIFDGTHLVMREDDEKVYTKCRREAPKSESYKAQYANVDCKVCRRV